MKGGGFRGRKSRLGKVLRMEMCSYTPGRKKRTVIKSNRIDKWAPVGLESWLCWLTWSLGSHGGC